MALCRQHHRPPRSREYARRPVAITALALLLPGVAEAGEEAGNLDACLGAVADAKGAEISCTYKTLLTPQERADMQRVTRGLLVDASCVVKVMVARALVEPALKEDDHVFEAPPQPVTCEITTKDGGFPISATFAPKVTFKGGAAADGTPGLGNVTGVNKYVAWPVVQYVNRSAGIRESMLEVVNRYRTVLRAARR